MKRLAVITTSLLLSLTALSGTVTAFAEESETVYPNNGGFIKTLNFTDFKDYEIDGDTYYFADGDTLYTFANGKLDEAPLSQSEFEFSPAQSAVIIGNYTFNLTGTTLKVADFDGNEIQPFEGEYSLLKQFGDKAYAIKENALYCFDSAQAPVEIRPEYFDFSVTQKISVGNTAEALKNYQALKFVTVKTGTVMTAIDLTSLDGEYFTLENTEEGVDISVNTISLKEDKTALLLCYTGNAAIIAIGDSSYILYNDPEALQETAVDCTTEPEYKNATIVGNRIYASPFTVIGTTLLPNAASTIVTVKCKLTYPEVLNSVYYEVEYETADGVKTGYVAEGFLTEFIIEDNKEPSTVPDPEHSDKTNVTTVLLILAVVVLVLIALGYIVYTTTSGKKKKGKKENIEEEKKE